MKLGHLVSVGARPGQPRGSRQAVMSVSVTSAAKPPPQGLQAPILPQPSKPLEVLGFAGERVADGSLDGQ